MLGVAVSTLRRWHSSKKLIPQCRSIGGHRRYRKAKDTHKFDNTNTPSTFPLTPTNSKKYDPCQTRPDRYRHNSLLPLHGTLRTQGFLMG